MTLPTYSRTFHLESSVAQPGSRTPGFAIPFSEVAGCNLVIEEKVDGTHAGLFFDEDLNLVLFSRNTILSEHSADRNLCHLIRLADVWMDELFAVLDTRYVLYGEWAMALHTIYYDQLPAFFLEDDVYDRERGVFLSTPERAKLTTALPEPFSHSVPVLASGEFSSLSELTALVGSSTYKTARWRDALRIESERRGLSLDDVLANLDDSDAMEGLYIKEERDGAVQRRLKWVRYEFLRAILDSGQHWKKRPLIPNRLA